MKIEKSGSSFLAVSHSCQSNCALSFQNEEKSLMCASSFSFYNVVACFSFEYFLRDRIEAYKKEGTLRNK